MTGRVRLWWQAAQDDWAAAHTLFSAGQWAPAVVHCNECIEKNLKSLYIHKKSKVPPPTHNLGSLVQKLGLKPSPALETALYMLMPHFSISRYPDAADGVPSEKYNESLAKDLLDATEKIKQWLEQHLK